MKPKLEGLQSEAAETEEQMKLGALMERVEVALQKMLTRPMDNVAKRDLREE